MTHWGDRVAETTSRLGPLAIGIDPVEAQAPLALATGDAGFCLRYTEFVLSVAEGRAGFVKFQSAFFEAYGSAGIAALAGSIALARKKGFGVIMDAKRGDIGSTAEAYASAYLDPADAGGSDLEADCVTVNPFLGPDTLEPFVARARRYGKGVLVLVKTSNPGSGWLQDRVIDGTPVSTRAAMLVGGLAEETAGASGVGAVGAVIGSTYPAEAEGLRELLPNAVILAPGIGAQGGDIEGVRRLRTPTGPLLAPVSRGIGFAEDRGQSLDQYAALIDQRITALKDALG